MKNILILALVSISLVACGSDKKEPEINTEITNFEELFRVYAGTYGVVGCNASPDQTEICSHKTVELLFTTEEDGGRSFNLRTKTEIDHGNGHREIRIQGTDLAYARLPDAACSTYPGQQVCSSSKIPGASFVTKIVKVGNITTVEHSQTEPGEADSHFLLQLEMI